MAAPVVLPDWWSFLFMGMQIAALTPIAYASLVHPLREFRGILPPGFDKATDDLKSSKRIEMVYANNAQTYPIIAITFIGCTLFARNCLKGQPRLQQRLMLIPIAAGLLSDVRPLFV